MPALTTPERLSAAPKVRRESFVVSHSKVTMALRAARKLRAHRVERHTVNLLLKKGVLRKGADPMAVDLLPIDPAALTKGLSFKKKKQHNDVFHRTQMAA